MKSCTNCRRIIPPARLEVLPNTEYCVECAAKFVKPKKGAMHYGHKTAPTLIVMDGDFFNKEWKHYNPSFGRGSGVHKITKSTSTY